MTKKFKTLYGERTRVQAKPEGKSLTQQHFKDEVNVINIIKKHDRTGIIEHVQRGMAQYGDFSQVNEYRENLDFVINAQNQFMQLPADVRKKFANDPGTFFEFATDPKNEAAMQEMGLLPASPPPEEVQIPPVAPAKKADKDTKPLDSEGA